MRESKNASGDSKEGNCISHKLLALENAQPGEESLPSMSNQLEEGRLLRSEMLL
jgi:hypothetical protein